MREGLDEIYEIEGIDDFDTITRREWAGCIAIVASVTMAILWAIFG